MKFLWRIPLVYAACMLVLLSVQASAAEESKSDRFREILNLSEIGPDVLAKLGQGPDFSEKDWKVLLEVANRLAQFDNPDTSEQVPAGLGRIEPARKQEVLGEIFRVRGTIDSVEKMKLPTSLQKLTDWKSLYACQLRFFYGEGYGSGGAHVLSTSVPRAWQNRTSLNEHVTIRGVLVQVSAADGLPILLTNHIAWHPEKGVSAGQLLLAKHGMDIALLDEVRHRQSFVKPEVSREGEAFYAALVALGKTTPSEIEHLAKSDLPHVVEKWRSEQPALKRRHLELEAALATATDPIERKELQQEIKQAKNQRALAATVVKQGEAGQSSVAPMFLHPEKEVGELFVFDGTARRAVWIASPEQANIAGYYELEVYPNESRLLNNQPVVCCVRSLPDGFPTGDAIRAPVRIAGVFFKSWRYRSRNLQSSTGQTGEQRKLYTPIVLSNAPQWLQPTSGQAGNGALWGGIAFLCVLATLWIGMVWLARRDRMKRAALRPRETIDL